VSEGLYLSFYRLDMPALMAIDRAWTVTGPTKVFAKGFAMSNPSLDMICLSLRALYYPPPSSML
jgi:hypothetical protein